MAVNGKKVRVVDLSDFDLIGIFDEEIYLHVVSMRLLVISRCSRTRSRNL